MLTNRAVALHALGRYEEALQGVENALAIEPRLANAHLTRGHILAKLDRHDEATESYERARSLDPKSVSVDPTAGGGG